MRLIHAERAELGHFHDIGRTHHRKHRVARVTPRRQCRQDRADLIFQEDHGDNTDVRGRDVGAAALQGGGVGLPIGGGVQG